MDVLITIKNYRCFSDSNPARIKIRKGFTAFIGVNNSGKSTLLKFFYEFRNIFESLSNINNLAKSLETKQKFKLEILSGEEVFCNSNSRDISVEFCFLPDGSEIKKDNIEQFTIIVARDSSYYTYIKIGKLDLAGCKFKDGNWTDETQIVMSVFDNEDGSYVDNGSFHHLLQVFANLSKTFYIGPFRNVINVNELIDGNVKHNIDNSYLNYFDIKVGRNFMLQWRKFKTGSDRNQKQVTIDVTNYIRRIFNLEQLEIHYPNDDQSMELIINQKIYTLSELGSGLAQFILVLFNVAIQKPSYILIDEPELNLHPSLQLDFLTTLANYATEGTLFATHSIGLARSSADYIYTVRRTTQGSEVSEYEKNPSLLELLGELSYSTYRELGFDKVLLVEGRTDIKTIQQFLRKYKQDQHILVLSLGGKDFINEYSIGELEEIKRISDQISILIDSEKNSPDVDLEKYRKKFQENCQEIGIYCHILKYRATENYFTDRAIKAVKGDKYSELKPYQLLKDASPHWDKSENWRIAKEMTIKELEATDLGEFLKNICNS